MPATRHLPWLLATAALAAIAACGPQGPQSPASVQALGKKASIANLMQERLRGDLLEGRATEAPSTYPARVRILPYDHQSALQKVDVLSHLEGLAATLRKHPELAREVSVLPEAYGDSIGASFDGLMKLNTTLRADVFLLVSNRTTFLPAREKGVSPFDWFGRKSWWEAHATIEALWVEAPSGRYLPSIQSAAKGGPDLVEAEDETTTGTAYALRRQVEQAAFKRLADSLVTQLKAEQAAVAARATPAPTAVPEAEATEAAKTEASGEAEATPAAEATAS
ncbi:MAG: hypothetical protein ACLGIN_09910 [Candidatus Sericytochromatia bacterium]